MNPRTGSDRRCRAATSWRLVLVPAGLLICLGSSYLLAQAKPKPPPGRDPGGIAIALIGPGIDNRDADIAARLARDGEGELIAWDTADGDPRPFAPAGADAKDGAQSDGTELARMLLAAYADSRLISVRVAPGDGSALTQALRFIVRSPARIVALALLRVDEAGWRLIREAAIGRTESLFVLPASEDPMPGSAAALPGNVVLVAPASLPERAFPSRLQNAEIWVKPRGFSMFGSLPDPRPRNAAEATVLAAAAAACAQHRQRAASGTDAKALLIAMGSTGMPASGGRELDPICWYGGQPR